MSNQQLTVQKIYGRIFLGALSVMAVSLLLSWGSYQLSGEQGAFPRGLFRAAAAFRGNGKGFSLSEVDEKQELIFEGLQTLTIRSTATDVRLVVDQSPTPEGKPAMAEFALRGMAVQKEAVSGRRPGFLSATRNGADFQVVVQDATGTESWMDWSWLIGHITSESEEEPGLELTVKLPQSFQGVIELKTTSGDFKIEGVRLSRLNVLGVSSDLKLEGVELHEAHLAVTSGDVEFEGRVDRLKVKSVSGDLQVELDPSHAQELERLEVETTSGDVKAYLSAKLNARVEASTVSGEITTDLEPLIAAGFTQKQAAEAKLGDGAAQIRLKTVSGEIEILRHDALN